MKKIKIILFTLGCALTIIQCHKHEFSTSFKSIIDGTFNGNMWKKVNWTLLGSFSDKNAGIYFNLRGTNNSTQCIKNDRFSITFAQYDELKDLRETIIIDGISKFAGRFPIIDSILPDCNIKDSVRVNFYTSIYYDVPKDFYDKIDTKHKNFVEITEFNKNQVKGTFDIKFIMTRRRDLGGSNYPDTAHLKGSFDIKK